jgi:hypothetical protein
MTGPPAVDEVSVAPVGLADGPAKVIGSRWFQDQMNVVGHQAIGPSRNPRLQCLLSEKIEIDFVVAVFKEDGLAPVATLGNMMWKPRNHDASQPRHMWTIAFHGGIGIMSPYFPISPISRWSSRPNASSR